MKIQLHQIKIRDVVAKYEDHNEKGVFGYNGLLDIRPSYQREFVYKPEQRNAVIETVKKGFPLNVMYWIVNLVPDPANPNQTIQRYEVLDGQQRTISICQYVSGDFSVGDIYFHNLPQDKKDAFLDYELMIYFCEGSESEKLDWFRAINIAGEKLTDQELRNAIYTGPWLSDAKDYFSRRNCVAEQKAARYLKGSPIRQEYLETVLRWISDGKIEEYMGKHQHEKDADALRQYFVKVIDWVERTFTTYRKEMDGLEWGEFYDTYQANQYNTKDLEKEIAQLMADEEVQNKRGIYEYVLSKGTLRKCLSLRAFDDKTKATVFQRQTKAGTGKATCPMCNDDTKLYTREEMEADHIIPWSKGGKTTLDNCQMLCRLHNGLKSNK
jgi:hypothetical protein